MNVNLSDATGRQAVRYAAGFPAMYGGLDDRTAILQEADHRIGNHLALLTSYVRLQAAALTRQDDEPSRDAMHILLDGVGAQIAAVARLHRDLTWEGRLGANDLGEHLHQICAGFTTGLKGGTELVERFQPGCVVQPEQILPLSQIVAEVITKALSRSHDMGGTGAVLVGCGRDDAGGVVVEVSDTCPGPAATFDADTTGGFGYRLVRALCKQLGARMEIQSTDHGVHFRLSLHASTAWPVGDSY